MIFRLLSLALTLAIVGYMFYAMRQGDKAVENIPAVQEQKQVLKDAGVDTSSQKALSDYTLKQAQELKAYQDQLDTAPPQE